MKEEERGGEGEREKKKKGGWGEGITMKSSWYNSSTVISDVPSIY